MKFTGKVGNGQVNKGLNFGGIWITDPDTDPDPYHDTDKTCLGRGMQCPSASSIAVSFPSVDILPLQNIENAKI